MNNNKLVSLKDTNPEQEREYIVRVPDTSNIELANMFEEDVLVYKPRISEMIYKCRDVDEPFSVLAKELNITQGRFERIYQAAKKEIITQANFRIGQDIKMSLVDDADKSHTRLLREKREFIEEYERVKKKVIDQGDHSGLTLQELSVYTMKPSEYQRVLTEKEKAIISASERKSKLMGVEAQKKVVVTDGAKDLLSMMLNIERQKWEESKDQDYIDVEAEDES